MNWIKTSEQLPETGKTVLTVVNYDERNTNIFIVGYYGGDGRWYDDETHYKMPDYWCEIEPKPPKV